MVLYGIIRAMDGEQFHIHLSANAKAFCITSPRSISFAYRDKLATELAATTNHCSSHLTGVP